MSATRTASLVALLLLCSTASAQERVTLVHYRADRPKQKAMMYTFNCRGPTTPFIGPVVTSALHLPKVAGKKPLSRVFPADWDGDGSAELVLVREFTHKPDRPMDLKVYRMPDRLFGRLGTKVASSRGSDLGNAAGEGRIVALGSGNVYPGGADELLIVRESVTLQQSLEIRSLPPGKNKAMGSPLLSDTTFGYSTDSGVISIFGSDLNGDGVDEIVTLRRDAGRQDRVLLFEAPLTEGGETGPAIASYEDVTADEGFENVSMSGFDLDGDGQAEIMLQQRREDGTERLLVHSLPTALDDDLGPPLAVEENPCIAGEDHPLLAAFGGIPSPPDYRFLRGPWQLSITATPLATGAPVVYGPYTTQASMNENRLSLRVATWPIALTGPVDLTDDPIGMVTFASSSFSFPFPGTTSTINLTFGSGVIDMVGTVLTIGFDNASGQIVDDATGDVKSNVTEVVFRKVP